MGQLIKDASRARVVIGGSICIGELLMWKNSDPVCFFFDNELGQGMVEGFPNVRSFVDWVEARMGSGHNIHFA
jgi:hypothetical protein